MCIPLTIFFQFGWCEMKMADVEDFYVGHFGWLSLKFFWEDCRRDSWLFILNDDDRPGAVVSRWLGKCLVNKASDLPFALAMKKKKISLYHLCDQIFHIVHPFRDVPAAAAPYGNIMYDRRIVRGNTYAQHTLPAVRYLVLNVW